MINVPIEIGDTILAGHWRNKRVEVKEIGTDEWGHPTVNGKPILKIRIAKLMKKASVKKIATETDNKYKLFVFRDMADSEGNTVQVSSVNGQEISLSEVDREIQMYEGEKARAQEQIDYWTDIKTKLETETAKEA